MTVRRTALTLLAVATVAGTLGTLAAAILTIPLHGPAARLAWVAVCGAVAVAAGVLAPLPEGRR